MGQPSPVTLSDRMRAAFTGVTSRAGWAVAGIGIQPDWITWAGLVVVAIGAFFIARGEWAAAFLLMLLSLPLDALDGATARAMKRSDRRGGVLDSTLDRYADGLIAIGFAYYYAAQNDLNLMLLALAGMIGTFAVSYVRARAGEAGLSVKVGWFSRFERVVTLLIMLGLPILIPAWTSSILVIGLWILAIGTNLTALQRLLYVYKHLDRG
ncbi:MAG TPA: CDP-alcohol phosphatidyltransferase family protein [Candidatus Limnocylindrales bacterium]|nr:CDP-alcohol phosphatidyltransferase family protein [Candidatus Limnocylindrales bacterium]